MPDTMSAGRAMWTMFELTYVPAHDDKHTMTNTPSSAKGSPSSFRRVHWDRQENGERVRDSRLRSGH